MDSVKKARNRFRNYPVVLADCHSSGAAYAKCVLASDSIKINECAKEFDIFKKCLQNAAKKRGIKL